MGHQSESTFRRRDIIKKSAVAGAVVWTAPMIVSSRALATRHSGEGGPGDCANFAIVKIEGGGPTVGTLFCALNEGYVQANPTSQAVVRGSYSEGAGGCFTLPDDVRLVSIIGKKRVDECNNLTPAKAAIEDSGGIYCVAPGQSHIMVVVCSDKDFTGMVIQQGIDSQPLPPLEQSSTDFSTLDDQTITQSPAPADTTTTTQSAPPADTTTTTSTTTTTTAPPATTSSTTTSSTTPSTSSTSSPPEQLSGG